MASLFLHGRAAWTGDEGQPGARGSTPPSYVVVATTVYSLGVYCLTSWAGLPFPAAP